MTTYDHQCNWHMSSFWQHRSSVCPQNAPLHVNNISKYTRENNHKPAIQNILGWIQTLSVHVKRPFRKLCRHKQNETSDKFRPKYTALFFAITVQKSRKMFVFLHNNDLDIMHSNRAGNIYWDVNTFTQIAEDYLLTWFLATMAAADDGWRYKYAHALSPTSE